MQGEAMTDIDRRAARRLRRIVALLVAATVVSLAQIPQSASAGRSYTKADFDAFAQQMLAQGDACVYVSQGGKVVGEWYASTQPATKQHSVMSFTKSLASTLVGIAQDKKLLKVSDKVSKYVTAWNTPQSKDITIAQVLSMTTGRSDNGYGFAIGNRKYANEQTQLAPPGTEWRYNSSAVQVLEEVLATATKMPVSKFAEDNLLKPLGIKTNLIADASGATGMFIGWQATCKEAAALVNLYLEKGKVNGRQIVSSSWVTSALTSSSTLNAGYGYLWWLNNSGSVMNIGERPRTGRLMQTWPTDAFWMQGVCHQFAVGVPSSKLVVVRLRPNCWGAQAIAAEQANWTPTKTFIELLGKILKT